MYWKEMFIPIYVKELEMNAQMGHDVYKSITQWCVQEQANYNTYVDYELDICKRIEFSRYRAVAAQLINLVAIWENQLQDFCERSVKDKDIKNQGIDSYFKFIANKYFGIENCEKGQFYKLFDFGHKIEHIQNLINVLKHGRGKSYYFLKKNASEYVLSPVEFACVEDVSSNIILNISEKDIDVTKNVLIAFWKEIENKIEQKEKN